MGNCVIMEVFKGVVTMTEKEFLEEQEECAKMLGMTLEEYLEYLKNIKVPDKDFNSNYDAEKDKERLLNYFGISEDMLMERKDD